jgi:hypothetical protein
LVIALSVIRRYTELLNLAKHPSSPRFYVVLILLSL